MPAARRRTASAAHPPKTRAALLPAKTHHRLCRGRSPDLSARHGIPPTARPTDDTTAPPRRAARPAKQPFLCTNHHRSCRGRSPDLPARYSIPPTARPTGDTTAPPRRAARPAKQPFLCTNHHRLCRGRSPDLPARYFIIDVLHLPATRPTNDEGQQRRRKIHLSKKAHPRGTASPALINATKYILTGLPREHACHLPAAVTAAISV